MSKKEAICMYLGMGLLGQSSVRFTRRRKKKLLAFMQVTEKSYLHQSGSNMHTICAPFVPET